MPTIRMIFNAMVEWMEMCICMARGFATQRIATKGSPLLLAERNVWDDAKTVLIYLQVRRATRGSISLVSGGPIYAGFEGTYG